MQQKIFIILTAIIGCGCALFNGDESALSPHIVGGTDADIRQFPFLVSIRLFGSHYCAGSIYTSRLIITAAHCIIKDLLSFTTVVAGSSTLSKLGTERLVKRTYVHPLYKTSSKDYDIAIIVLNHPFVFKDSIKPIELDKIPPPAYLDVKVVGWGYKWEGGLNSNQLQEATIKILYKLTCEHAFDTVHKGVITRRMICAGTKDGSRDACQNDSGGPLVNRNKLVGIVSFGVGCGRKEFPGVYTSIPELYKWIEDVSRLENQIVY